MQWDAGAYMLYDKDSMEKIMGGSMQTPEMPKDATADCLLQAQKNKESNLACMDYYLSMQYRTEANRAVFFKYEKLDPAEQRTAVDESDHVDACLVFSGPAKLATDNVTAHAFKQCAHDYTETGCMIPHTVWSSASRNKVPVAKMHTVEESSTVDREQNARKLFKEANEMAMKALNELRDFSDKNLEVVLFSGEGDSIHQIFDCIMMGPFSRVDLWDRGAGFFLLY